MSDEAMKLLRAGCGLLLLLIAALLPLPGRAALDGRFTDDERVGFGFAALTGTRPDFASWVRQEESWQQTPPGERDHVLARQVTRLNEGLAAYEANIDLIHAMAKVTVTWLPADARFGGAHDIGVFFKPPGAIFSYRFGDRRIDILPEQLDNRMSFRLSPDEFSDFARNAGKGGTLAGIFEFYLQPVAADAGTPMNMHGETTWPMIARVAHMTLWSGNHQQILWSFDAPWYKQAQNAKLLSLYAH